VLGVPRNSTLEDIKKAYRILSLKYHPKNNQNDESAKAKFIEVNQAYNALSNALKRKNYDDILWGTMVPMRAHNIFDDFFGNRFTSLDDDDLIKPILHKRWSKDLDSLMLDENDEKNIKDGETIKTSSVFTSNNGVQSKKTVTTKKKIKDGKVEGVTTEEYEFPNGDKNITKTITGGDGKIESHKYTLKKGENLPKELMN
jgi:curved DNA-binding protein CbpA